MAVHDVLRWHPGCLSPAETDLPREDRPMRRMGSLWLAVLLASTGCATAPRAPAPAIPAGVSEPARAACQEFARSEADRVKGKSVAGGAALGLLEGIGAGAHALIAGAIVLGPFGAIWGAVSTASDNAALRGARHDWALNVCLAPVVAEQTRGPVHPEVADRLDALGRYHVEMRSRFADAEPFVRRALAIRQAAYGPESEEVAQNLYALAGSYQAAGRHSEAVELEARASAIEEMSWPMERGLPSREGGRRW